VTPAPSQLVDTLRAALGDRPEVLDAYLFGSRATGRERPDSDVDVAVFLDPGRTAEHGRLQLDLIGRLESASSGQRADMVVLNRAPPLLYHRVLRDGIRLVSRDLVATTRREGFALSRYFDDLPRLEANARVLSARIRAGEFGR
jgi:predicted nucleotidyltransferase